MNHSYPLFRGFSCKQDLTPYSPALHALRLLREDSLKKGKNTGDYPNIGAVPIGRLDKVKKIIKQGENSFPSRKETFPSNYVKLTKWFYNILFLLFVSLSTGLLLWGRYQLGLITY